MADIIKKAKDGDSAAFAELIHQYKDKLYKAAWAILKSENDADLALLETIKVAFNRIDALKEELFDAWLIKLLINSCYKILEGREKVVNFDDEDAQNAEPVLWQMSIEHRTAFALHYYAGLSIEDIAMVLRISEGAVALRLDRAGERSGVDADIEVPKSTYETVSIALAGCVGKKKKRPRRKKAVVLAAVLLLAVILGTYAYVMLWMPNKETGEKIHEIGQRESLDDVTIAFSNIALDDKIMIVEFDVQNGDVPAYCAAMVDEIALNLVDFFENQKKIYAAFDIDSVPDEFKVKFVLGQIEFNVKASKQLTTLKNKFLVGDSLDIKGLKVRAYSLMTSPFANLITMMADEPLTFKVFDETGKAIGESYAGELRSRILLDKIDTKNINVKVYSVGGILQGSIAVEVERGTQQGTANVTYMDFESNGISIKYPNNWRLADGEIVKDAAKVMLQSRSAIDFEADDELNAEFRKALSDNSVAEYAKAWDKSYADRTMVVREFVMLNGELAYKTLWSEDDWQCMEFNIIKNRKVYTITFGGYSGALDNNMRDVEDMMGSIVIE